MSDIDVLWLSASPSLKRLDQPLLRYLAQHRTVAQWSYRQTPDEASSLDGAVALLHDFLQHQTHPVHLIGHGLGGVLGLCYARQYPDRLHSLTLLAVAAQPANTWQAHYYVQRQLFPCSQQLVLAQTVRSLFGSQPPYPVRDLVTALGRDLGESPSMHSLFKLSHLPKGGVAMPLLLCGSKTDPVVSSPALNEWNDFLKPNDTLLEVTDGRHFFHYFYPEAVGKHIVEFWRSSHPASIVVYPSAAIV